MSQGGLAMGVGRGIAPLVSSGSRVFARPITYNLANLSCAAATGDGEAGQAYVIALQTSQQGRDRPGKVKECD